MLNRMVSQPSQPPEPWLGFPGPQCQDEWWRMTFIFQQASSALYNLGYHRYLSVSDKARIRKCFCVAGVGLATVRNCWLKGPDMWGKRLGIILGLLTYVKSRPQRNNCCSQ